ncbi:MAG: NAD(P)-binding domain-containing protein [Candidatus Sulfotelmatobacter sp.]|jgi:ornithine cyclodeaminase/alanine dehydrogenase-like protein (mu-crystallin family)
MIPVLRDEDILPLLDMQALIPLMEEFLRARHSGHTVAPPRHNVEFPPFGRLVFTIGGLNNADRALAGFRVYDTFPTADDAFDAQTVAVWDSRRGALLGLVVGWALGAWRTGALGGVAIKHMSRQAARRCAVLGSGRQARTQLLAAAACRSLSEVRVYSRNPERRRQFATELAGMTKLNIQPVASAQEAVEQADLVLCATNSRTPVLETNWLSPGAHVNTLGPQLLSAHQLPTDIAGRVTLLAADAVEQVKSHAEPYFLAGSALWNQLQDLATLVAVATPPRSDDGISLFCSSGLAGTEVLAAAYLLERYRLARQ